MKAKVKRNGEIFIVHVSGKILMEPVEVFRQGCLTKLIKDKFIFNFDGLSFVGSNGITPFLEALREFERVQGRTLKMYNVPSEFQKIFAANLAGIHNVYTDEEVAMRSFYENVPTINLPDPVVEDTVELEGDVTIDPLEAEMDHQGSVEASGVS